MRARNSRPKSKLVAFSWLTIDQWKEDRGFEVKDRDRVRGESEREEREVDKMGDCVLVW
jgi:hypothetical protein